MIEIYKDTLIPNQIIEQYPIVKEYIFESFYNHLVEAIPPNHINKIERDYGRDYIRLFMSLIFITRKERQKLYDTLRNHLDLPDIKELYETLFKYPFLANITNGLREIKQSCVSQNEHK